MNLSKRNIARFYIVAYILISLLLLTLIWQYSRLRQSETFYNSGVSPINALQV